MIFPLYYWRSIGDFCFQSFFKNIYWFKMILPTITLNY
uniref:Uncharacterized protein n=1 Tax=virus sp. ctKgb28 TaxID=2826799 RepID=A0A8S5R8C9_9VIRU|nr:MAG TPA: hypothetical protein [virus sp. ctKgb28]